MDCHRTHLVKKEIKPPKNNSSASLETLILLNLFQNYFSFITVKSEVPTSSNVDQENNYQICSVFNPKLLENSSLALLLGINLRYESYSLNLLLRQRYFER